MTTPCGVHVGILLDTLYSVDKISFVDYTQPSTSLLTG